MKFGTYFAYWEQEWRADYPFYCDKVARLGFDVLEIGAAAIPAMSDADLKALKDAAAKAGIALSACIGMPADVDVSSADPAVRQKGKELLKTIMVGMEKAGIGPLGGIIYAYWPCDYRLPVDKAGTRARSMESVREMADFARDHGVTMMLETVNRFEHFLLNTAAEATQFVKDIGKDNVKVMLDCFHMNIEEDFHGDAIRETGKYLGHFHIGECNRKVPGKGHMPWDDIGQGLRDIGFDGMVVMEPFVRMGGQVGSDIKVWRDLSENGDDAKLDADIAEALKFVKKKFVGPGA